MFAPEYSRIFVHLYPWIFIRILNIHLDIHRNSIWISPAFCKFGSLANIQQGYSWISEGMLSEYSEELPCYMGTYKFPRVIIIFATNNCDQQCLKIKPKTYRYISLTNEMLYIFTCYICLHMSVLYTHREIF